MSLFVLKSKKYASFSDEKVLKSANSSFNWKKKKLNIEICGLSWPGNSRDIRGAFSAGLFGCPQDCLSPGTVLYSGPLKSYAEMKHHSGGHFKKFYMKTPTKKKLYTELLKNLLSLQSNQSRETIPFNYFFLVAIFVHFTDLIDHVEHFSGLILL